MICLRDITLSFYGKKIFDHLSWNIPDGSRIGLIGDNGAGKSTLLKIILGLVQPDSGAVEIVKKREKSIGYLPQDLAELEPVPLLEWLKKRCGITAAEKKIQDYEKQIAGCVCSLSPVSNHIGDNTENIRESLRLLMKSYDESLITFQKMGGYSFEARAKKVLHGLGFNEEDFNRQCTEFSGGWKMRILLAEILLASPDIMLLDEPINHLDTESLEWIEDYLSTYRGTLIIVAHDRVFLDKTVKYIAELSNGKLEIYKGNYSMYIQERKKRLLAREQALALQEAELEKVKAFVEKFRYNASRARQVQSRLRMLEKMETLEVPGETNLIKLRFPEAEKSGKIVLQVRNLGKWYQDKKVFSEVTLTITRGQKVALVGANGSGKSTFLRIIAGAERSTEGTVTYGTNVHLTYFAQESADNLNYSNTVWDEVSSVPSHLNNQQKRDLLGTFLFSGDDIYKKIEVLSGGEKSRLALLKVLLQPSNLLILDEPTNHLDIKTKEIFQEALLQYKGTVIIVSHDRYFLDSLVDTVIEFRNGSCTVYPGNYSYYIEKRHKDREETEKGKEVNRQKRDDDKAARERERRLEEKRIKREKERKIASIEERISQLENRKVELELAMANPENLRSAERMKNLKREYLSVNESLEKLYSEWETQLKEWEESK
ncbi:MAG: ABC-F family ATP-binding cassette domain-containing protein [Syntrophales bacterium]|nr:ABC-F family ATP-binding cassette domain-containing protein [Syntrophales bacterium]